MQALTKQQIAQAKALFASLAHDDIVSADEATQIITEVTMRETLSSKTVRQYLRKSNRRDQKTMKNATWRISEALLLEVCEVFNRKTQSN